MPGGPKFVKNTITDTFFFLLMPCLSSIPESRCLPNIGLVFGWHWGVYLLISLCSWQGHTHVICNFVGGDN